jgi:stearoyl-CoA desaturase (delta-9 desaturase)
MIADLAKTTKVVFSNAGNTATVAKLILRGFLIFHLGKTFYPTFTYHLAVLCFLSCSWRVFANHAGGHRYFSHKSFDCQPWFCKLLAYSICCTEAGPFFYWCLMHNYHHIHCDEGKDIHSPRTLGFWTVQLNIYDNPLMMKFLQERIAAPSSKKIMSSYAADLSWLNPRINVLLMIVENIAWVMLSMALGYKPFELYLYAVLIPRYYTAQAIALTNSAAHIFGPSPYCGREDTYYPNCHATNCWWVSVLNGGEGWHSNHHAFCKSARHGLLWWEFDPVYYTLIALAYVGVVWDVITVHDDIRLLDRNEKLSKKPDMKYIKHFPSKTKAA